jgi:hypothetical protein
MTRPAMAPTPTCDRRSLIASLVFGIYHRLANEPKFMIAVKDVDDTSLEDAGDVRKEVFVAANLSVEGLASTTRNGE